MPFINTTPASPTYNLFNQIVLCINQAILLLLFLHMSPRNTTSNDFFRNLH